MPRRALLLALAAAALVAGGAWWTARSRPARPDSAAWRAVGASLAARYPDVRTVSTDALAAELDARPAPLLLDAREPAEYAVSHLPGARRVDPDASADALAAALGGVDRDRPAVVYCSVGARSAAVAARLADAGFADVRNLEGSIFRWAGEGRPLVGPGGAATDLVHPYDAVWGRLLDAARRAPLP
ncbi:rhodanese-like domain-containing protein [Rubrivirga sp. S365]|uniref:rhodanese-like domain-containing protein n=1 Tax=Rubrivirga sp. S365 TaxID=3076080 RepID=UPI0028C51F0F|nr:rhodanese-like domain-containing protein [Rubrivirga sp. S365]MDT7855918.1 rhodanese-like domain-containing protein [Rubrivirga sp. S365]